MSYRVEPPKFAQVIAAIRERIESGAYPPGSMLPSEHQFAQEFRVSRPTIVRSLQVLRDEGWIEAQQGKGRFVRGRPAMTRRGAPDRFPQALDADETAGVELLSVGPVLASSRIAAALEIPQDTPVIARRRRVMGADGPVDLATVYFPVELTAGTDLAKPEPIPGGARVHVEARKNVRTDYVTERLSARMPVEDEQELLDLAPHVPVITVLLVAHDATGQPLQVIDLVLPADRHDIEDTYPLN